MSGAGRKHRAKQSTANFMDETWDGVLAEGEEPCVVVSASEGGRRLGVAFPPVDSESALERDDIIACGDHNDNTINTMSSVTAQQTMISIPARFHKVIWVMRGDVVLAEHRSSMTRKLSTVQIRSLLTANPQYEAFIQASVATLGPRNRDSIQNHRSCISHHQASADVCEEDEEHKADELVNPNAPRYHRVRHDEASDAESNEYSDSD